MIISRNGVGRGIAIIEGDAHGFSGAFDRIVDDAQLLHVDSHRLFGDYIAAEFHCPPNIEVVSAFYRRDNDNVWLGLDNHLVKLVGMISGAGRQPGYCPSLWLYQSIRVWLRIAQSHQFGHVAVRGGQGFDEHTGAAARTTMAYRLRWLIIVEIGN